MNELIEAKRAHDDAAAEARDAQAEYARLYTELQQARTERKTVQALELQGQLALALQRSEVSKQMLQGHQARVRAAEKRAVLALKQTLTAQYESQATALVDTLCLLMNCDLKLGNTAFDAAGIGGLRVPGYGSTKCDDTGALYSFEHLQPRMQATAKKLEALLLKEHNDEADVATA
jgi:hypothetical protein